MHDVEERLPSVTETKHRFAQHWNHYLLFSVVVAAAAAVVAVLQHRDEGR